MQQTYTVLPGDSLSSISKKFYGNFSMVNVIAALNKISNKELIHPGQELKLPEVEDATTIELIAALPGDTSTANKKWLWWLLVVAAAGGGYYAYKKSRSKSKLNGIAKKTKRAKRKK